jgi:hypothetical protein
MLETRPDGWDGWLRCPVCQRVSLPPETAGFLEFRQRLDVPNNDHATANAPRSPEGPMLIGDRRLAIALRSSQTSPARLIFTTGLVLSLVLALLAFLDLRPRTTAIFGFLAIAFFLMLLRTPRKRVVPWGFWQRTSEESKGPAKNESPGQSPSSAEPG